MYYPRSLSKSEQWWSNFILIVMALVLLAGALLVGSCQRVEAYCDQVQNVNKAQCVAYREVKICGPEAGVLVAFALPYLVSGDFSGLFAALESGWPQEKAVAQCVIDQLEKRVSDIYGPYSTKMVEWKTKRNAFEREQAEKKAK